MKKSKHRRLHQCSCATCRAHPYSQVAIQHRAINRVLAQLDEKNRRCFAGLLALQWGRRHIRLVSQITGLSRTTIYRGQHELEYSDPIPRKRVRALGAGRPPVEKNNRGFCLR